MCHKFGLKIDFALTDVPFWYMNRKKSVLGQRILIARRDLGWNQGELERRSGVSRGYISNIERGRITNVGVETLEALADALGVSIPYLLGRTDVPLPEESESYLRESQVVYEVEDVRERALIQELLEVFGELDEDNRRLLLELARRLRRVDETRTIGEAARPAPGGPGHEGG